MNHQENNTESKSKMELARTEADKLLKSSIIVFSGIGLFEETKLVIAQKVLVKPSSMSS